MTKVFSHLNRYRRIISYVDQRLAELEEGMKAFKAEVEIWKDIRCSIRPCPHCHGEGQLGATGSASGSVSQEMEDCPRCAGSGQAG